MSELAFETSIKQLEEIIKKLEKGDLPLEDAIKHFEDGTKLAKTCNLKLDEAQKKVETLISFSNGKKETKPFET